MEETIFALDLRFSLQERIQKLAPKLAFVTHLIPLGIKCGPKLKVLAHGVLTCPLPVRTPKLPKHSPPRGNDLPRGLL